MKSFTIARSLRAFPSTRRIIRVLLTVQSSRTLPLNPRIELSHEASFRYFATADAYEMSFSNTDTGDKPADPYKEQNKNETSLKEKVQDLVAFMEKCKFAMMTTRIGDSGLLVSRCMALAAKEGGGIDLLFHTNTESGKTDDLKSDPKINIAFLNSSGEWASVSGEATITTDRETIRKYYSPALKAWVGDLGDGKHDGGPEDPRIGMIAVKAVTATYAITNQSFLSRSMEVTKGMVTGSAPNVNMLRELSEKELEEWRSISS